MKNKKAFSFVELIIVLSILIMIAIVITKISGDTKDKADNSKIKSDIIALNSAVLSTFEQEKKIPLPDGNLNYYNSKGGYSHENFDDPTNPAFGVYGRITEKTIGRQFLSEVPRDPRTNWYYSYGILREGNFFDVAGVVKQKDDYKAKVMGSYAGDRGISDLIREYNGPYFVSDNGPNLPYNPEKVILTASDSSGNSFSEGDVLEYKDNKFSKNGVQINAQLTIEKNGKKYYELYFSDGNIGRLDFNNGEDYVKLTFGKDNHEFRFDDGGIKSKVSLFLEAGSLWVFASDTKKSESEFSIITQDITAAVRGTIFKVEKNNNLATKVIVVKGVVEITKGNQDAIISNPDLEIPFIIEDSNQSINQDGFEKPLKQLEFRAFEYDDGEILVKENLKLTENDFGKIENADFSEGYFGFKDGKYFTIGIDKENEFIFDKEIKVENDKLKTEEHRLNSSKILIDKDIYKKNCLEVFAGKIINKCVKTEAEITDGYEVVLALSATENNGNFGLNNSDDHYRMLQDINNNLFNLTCEKDIENAEKTPNPFIYKYDDSFWFYPNCTEKSENPLKNITKLEKTDDYIIEFEVRGEDFRKLVEEGGEIVNIGGKLGKYIQKYDIFEIEEKKFKVYDLPKEGKDKTDIGKSEKEIKNLEKINRYKIIIKKEKIPNNKLSKYHMYLIGKDKNFIYQIKGANYLNQANVDDFKIDIIYKYLINNLKVYKKKS